MAYKTCVTLAESSPVWLSFENITSALFGMLAGTFSMAQFCGGDNEKLFVLS